MLNIAARAHALLKHFTLEENVVSTIIISHVFSGFVVSRFMNS